MPPAPAPHRAPTWRGTARFGAAIDRQVPLLFLMPGFLCLLLVIAYPFFYNLSVSFTDLSLMYPGAAFVGLDNYAETLADPLLWQAAIHTLVYTAASVFGQLLLGLVAAVALDHVWTGRRALRLVLVIPWAFPAIVLAFGWRFMLDPLYGVTNHLLMMAGFIGAPVSWLSQPDWAMPAMVLITTWFGFPFMMVSITAAMAAIPRELYESSRVDGASFRQELVYVTLPLLLPVLGSLVILRTIWVFNNFDFIFLTTGGGPVTATTTLPLYAYQVGWQRFDIGRMAAVSVLMMILLVAILAVYMRVLRGRSVAA
jgi:multiple sugar transport system permease protein